MDGLSSRCDSNKTSETEELHIISGFKYPRRLSSQKLEKNCEVTVQRPILSPVRTRSQSIDPDNVENVKPSKSHTAIDIDLDENGAFPLDSPLCNRLEVSTSTPKRNRRSDRYSCNEINDDESFDRSRSRLGSPSSSFSLDGSRMSCNSESYRRRSRHRHPDYDPIIEIRQAKERHKKYRSGKWSDTSDLFDAVMEDKERYKEKLEKRARDKGFIDEQGNPEVDMEEDDEVLARRQRDIDNGKTTTEYEGYVKSIPKPLRKINQPRTPNKFIKYSRRQWDGLVRSWRRQLHTWDSDANTVDSMSSFSSSVWESPSPHSDRDSMRSSRGRSGATSRRSSFKTERRSTRRSPVKAVRFPMSSSSSESRIKNIFHEDEDTMMGFPGQTECNPALSSTPTIRKKRTSGQNNCNEPEPEALSTGLTSDVGDVILNVKGTPTKRKPSEQCKDDNNDTGGTPRKRPKTSNSGDKSFAQIVKMNTRSGGSPYKLRSQIRKTSTMNVEKGESNHIFGQSSDSCSQGVNGPVRKLEFNERD